MQDMNDLYKRRKQFQLFVSCTFKSGKASSAEEVAMMNTCLFKTKPADDGKKRPAGGQGVPAQEPHQHGQQCRRLCICPHNITKRDLVRVEKRSVDPEANQASQYV